MLTSTIAWCTPSVERARRAHSSTPGDFTLQLAQVLSKHFAIHGHIHGALSLIRPQGCIQGNTKLAHTGSYDQLPVRWTRSCNFKLDSERKFSWIKWMCDWLEQLQKFLMMCLKNKSYNWRWRILHAGQRQKQNRKEGHLLAFHQGHSMNEKELDWYWTRNCSLVAYQVSKKVIHPLRISQKVRPEDDGAVHFWRIKEHLQSLFHKFLIDLAIDGNHAWKQEEDRKGDTSTVLMFQEKFFTSELFKDIQDAILLIFHWRRMWWFTADSSIMCIFHIGCVFNLHSVINCGFDTWRSQFKQERQTAFFFPH